MPSLQAQSPATGQDTNNAAANAIATIGGTFADAGDGQPMPYATVMLVGTTRVSFADSQGHFRFTRLPFYTYHLRARQIGYAPLDTTILLAANAPSVGVTLRMQRVVVRLPAVAVQGSRARGCIAPGIPDSTTDPALAGVFAQLHENADRFRILLEAYPFRYRRVESVVLRSNPGGDSTLSVDTTTYESSARRPYEVGHVVYGDKDSHGHQVRVMYIPTFRDFADSAFLGTHCFQYAGMEGLGVHGTAPALRIDFRAADSIRVPDVAGSIYLDSASLFIRRAVFQLANARALHPAVLGLTVTTTYHDIATLVPVIDSVTTDEPLTPVSTMVEESMGGEMIQPAHRLVQRTEIEQATLLGYQFEGRIPGQVEPSDIVRAPQTVSATDVGTSAGVSPDTAPRAPTLAGNVTDARGTAIPAAVVALIGTNDTAATDDSGRFVLHGPRPGAYMLSVRRLGFEPQRLAVSISPERAGRVMVILTRTVPVLPTVTTTAAERRAYRDVGFDARMHAGVGYFLTYDQILRKQATAFGDLIKDAPGLDAVHKPQGWMISSKRSGCVSYVVDGKPQAVFTPDVVFDVQPGQRPRAGTALGEGSPDEVIDADNVGAIEYYEPSERPTQFGSNGCATVVVWTRTHLGLSASPASADDNTAINNAPKVRAAPPRERSAACALPALADTMYLPIYAILEGSPSRPVANKVWTAYADSVLSVIDRWSVLPTNVHLPTFGPAFTRDSGGSRRSARAGIGDVAPSVSSVFVFTLASSGTLTDARLAASALSGALDTSVLAELQRAADARAFPGFPGDASAHDSVRFDLLVTSIEPAVGTKAAVLGRLQVPVWPLAREARPLADSTGAGLRAQGAESVTVQMVVDAQGRAVSGTVRVLAGLRADRDSQDAAYRERVAQRVSRLRFEPAQIDNCRVPQLVTQSVVVPAKAVDSH